MPIHTDSRGYKYIGNQVTGEARATTWGDRRHDSITAGPSTSLVGEAMEAVLGTSKWGIASDNTGIWSGGNLSGASWAELVWQFPVQQPDLSNIDVTAWLPNANDWSNTPLSYIGCGFKLRFNSFGNEKLVINSISRRVQVSSSVGTSGTALQSKQVYWVSVTPTAVGVFADGLVAGSDPCFYYAGVMQGTTFAYPTNIAIMISETVGAQNQGAWRPRLQTLNNSQGLDFTGSTYADSLANFPNITGEPYITRYYPEDSSGVAAGSSGGYLPELFIYHNNDVGVGTVLNTADLTAGGSFNFNTLDGSDFTHCVCVAELDSANKRLFMRIGQTT